MSEVTDALALDEAAPSDLIDKIECAAATAMIEAYESIAQAAVLLARSTETCRTTEAAGARRQSRTSGPGFGDHERAPAASPTDERSK